MKYISLLILTISISSCFSLFDERKKEIFKTDKDFVEFYREFSPDKTHILINYGIDLGATGYGHCGTAIMKLADTTKDLRTFTLSNSFTKLTWIDNNKISAKREIIPFLRSGKTMDLSTQKIDSVQIEVSGYDFIEPSYHMEIEHKETSPDGKTELLAYRYLENRNNLSLIHVSLINKGDTIPKYGNYLIGEPTSDYVLYGTWARDNKLIFYTNDIYKDMIDYCLVKNRPNVEYKLVANDTSYNNKYRWREIKYK